MKRVLIFGIGNDFKKCKSYYYEHYDVIGLVDNDEKKQDQYSDGNRIIHPAEITKMDYDKIVVASSRYLIEITGQLLAMGVSKSKIDYDIPSFFDKCWMNQEGRIFAVRSGITAEITDYSDSVVFSEICVLYTEITGLENGIVIDIGSNVGIVSLYYASKDYIGRVYSYEPFTFIYEKGLINFSLNDKIRAKITHFNYGLGGCDEVRFINNINWEYSGGNSTTQIDETTSLNKDGVSVVIKNAATEIAKIAFENPGRELICKIDTEGSEFEIIKTMNDYGVLNQISAFVLEYHSIEYRSFIKQVLADNNFIVTDYPAFEDIGMLEAVSPDSKIRFLGIDA